MKSKYILFTIVLILATACASLEFRINKEDDKFSDLTKPKIITGENNRLSTKSSQGGIHIDKKGVYLEPYALIDRITGEIKNIGFYYYHINSMDGIFGVNPTIIIINSKNERIELKIELKDIDIIDLGWNDISKNFHDVSTESGTVDISQGKFEKIANAEWIEVKIEGSKRTQTYGKEDIAKNFISNLQKFLLAVKE